MKELEDQKATNTPVWLDNIHKHSWEAELLISGGAAFTLFQAVSGLFDLFIQLTEYDPLQSSFLVMLPMFSLIALTGGFMIHLVFRAFWISVVMLSRVYPTGIRMEKINLAEPYYSQSKNYEVVNFIERLDKACSLVFIWSLTLSLIMAGYAICATLAFFPSMLAMDKDPQGASSAMVILNIVGITLTFLFLAFFYLDLFTSGYLRRGKYIPKLYYPIYRFFNTLSLGFIWRPILQTLTTNLKNKRKTILLIIVGFYVMVSVSAFLYGIFSHGALPAMTKDKLVVKTYESGIYRDEDVMDVKRVSIQSKVVTQNYLDIFLKYDYNWKFNKDLKDERKFLDNLRIYINDSLYVNRDWIGMTAKHRTGVTTIAPIGHLSNKRHILKVISEKDTTTIPFWKQ